MTSADLRQQVNERLIQALAKDILPWRRPWLSPASGGRHRNLVTGRPYSGVNPLLLELHNLKHGFGSNLWMTFNQAKAAGCTIKKRPSHVPAGQWGCAVVLCKPVSKVIVNRETGEEDQESYLVLRAFVVFNAEQVSGAAVEQLRRQESGPPVSGPDYPTAQALIEATGAKLIHGGDRAYYARPLPEGTWPHHQDGDYVVLPERHRFESPEAYYETAFHELAHHSEVRLGWDHRKHGYSMGELVAEISATYVASEIGMPLVNFDNHAAYLKSWLEGMKQSPSFIFTACSAASRTADYLLSLVRPADGAPTHEGAGDQLTVAPA